jgi:MFS family permease
MKNIRLLYLIRACYYTWFWLGIWVLYYKDFGGFAAVGLLETVMIVTTILFEIPTGAVGDLLGKRKTLVLGYLLSGIAQIWMGFSPTLLHLVLSLIVMNIGGAFISGTFEAMVFDSLKDEGKEEQFEKVNAKMSSIYLGVLAISGVVGGFMYTLWVGLPYVVNGVFVLFAALLSLRLTEPKIDTEVFTLKNYLKQTGEGFNQLFRVKENMYPAIGILLVSVIMLILGEGVNDMIAVVFGYTEVQLGILASVLALTGAVASLLYAKFAPKSFWKKFLPISLVIVSISLIISPFVAIFIGGITLLIRAIISPIVDIQLSTVLNSMTKSKYRATTLSTFSMIKSIPYALLIYAFGVLADFYPITKIAVWLGFILLLAVAYLVYILPRKSAAVTE